MQRSLLVVLALSAAQLASALSVQSVARLFLRNHAENPPQQDELAELKGENPDAYALVKALLTKRSLGLLDPRHPTASFVHPSAEQEAQQKQAEQGPEVFSNMLRPGELEEAHVQRQSASGEAPMPQVDLPYAAVQPAAHKDWLNWKPEAAGAMSDDQMVQNVLGAVAELKGGKKAGLLSKNRNALADDAASMDVETPPPAPKPEPVVAAPAPRENSYLKSVDFGIRAPEAPEKPKENSYLKGLDLTGDMPQAVAPAGTKRTAQVQSDSTNALASFSWDDSKPQEQAKPKVVAQPEVKSNGKDHTLLSWLGVVHEAPPPQAVAAPVKPANPYLMDLN